MNLGRFWNMIYIGGRSLLFPIFMLSLFFNQYKTPFDYFLLVHCCLMLVGTSLDLGAFSMKDYYINNYDWNWSQFFRNSGLSMFVLFLFFTILHIICESEVSLILWNAGVCLMSLLDYFLYRNIILINVKS